MMPEPSQTGNAIAAALAAGILSLAAAPLAAPDQAKPAPPKHTYWFYVGAESADTIQLTKTEMSAAIGTAGTGGLDEIIDIGSATTVASADTAFAALTLDNIDEAIKNVSNARSTTCTDRRPSYDPPPASR